MPRPPPANSTEIVGRRTLRGKSWLRDDGKVVVRQNMSPIHFDDNGTLTDIDMVPTLQGQSYSFSNTSPYFGSVSRNDVGYTYVSRANPGNQVTVLLIKPAGPPDVPVVDFSDPFRIRFLWTDILPDIDIEIQLRSYGINTYTHIKTPAAAHTIQWQVILIGTLNIPDTTLESALGISYPEAITTVTVGQTRTVTVDPVLADFILADYPLLLH